MATAHSPKPRRRLLRTLLQRPRKLDKFASPLHYDHATATLPDPSEAAHWGEVCLFDDRMLVLHRDGTSTVSFHTAVMLHGSENLAAWDAMSLAYNRRTCRPSLRCARAYLPDGNAYDAVRKVQRLKRTPPDSPNEFTSISFPHLRPGTVLEWDFQEDEYRSNQVALGVWGEYFLQTHVPCRHRRVTVAIAQPFQVTVETHNTTCDPMVFEVGQYRVYQWELRDVPGIEFDNWVPAARDFAPWVDISTLSSWQPIAEHFERDLVPSTFVPQSVKRLARELTQGVTAPREQLSKVHQFLARDVRYGRHPQDMAMPKSQDMGRMLQDLRGDCKDKSVMMVSLLRELSIPAQIAVVLTGGNGRRPFLPANRFDHAMVMAEVDGERLWIDPAAGPYTFGDTPSADQGIQALLLGEATARVVEVPPAQPTDHAVERLSGGRLEADGTYCFETLVKAAGDRAAAFRDALQHRADEYRQTLITQSVAGEHPGAEVKGITMDQVDDLRAALRYKYTVTLPAWGRRIDQIMILRIPWFEPIEWAGLFTLAERSVPLATPAASSISEFHSIEIPDEFSGYGLPTERTETCPWAIYRCHVAVEDGQLRCERRVQFLGGIVSPEEFTQFKRFWESCVRWDQEDIVLVTIASQLGLRSATEETTSGTDR